ncbi:ATP-binding cassette domain-containing protein [Lactovum miscens]|uniref:ABC-type lipoprotein export system ATPase subunit/ABC-type antimicrobial peptide transport system permease subunit n=1 Tax=Lactovum miscens TaxID=190387 RepID=A0A841C8D2_9LACT|nr:ATP-binding cassette domain-containing protein [Lactovum miscens]MBB5887490.1 ABC-type lipoprotein export system ATPase subunit/ABC-type antimicrobial peptide transport system permease subunit [Lactovum miscens]
MTEVNNFQTESQEGKDQVPILELKKIEKSYFLGKEEFPVLKGIDLEVKRGEFVSLLGESGGGKSTLMNIIGGLDREYQGQVIIEGNAQKSKKEKDMDAYRRDTIGFIFQSFNLVSYLSVLDNVLVSLKMTNLSDKEQTSRALDLIKQVGLYEHRKKKPSQLSGGQKQRVAIARALASDPDIILADEPTGALDSVNTEEVLEILESIARSGKTVFVVTHSQEVAEHGTRIIHLEDGRILNDTRLKDAYPIPNLDKEFKPKALTFLDTFKTSFKHFINAWKINLLIAIGSAIGLASVMFFLGLGAGATNYMNNMVKSLANPNVFLAVRRSPDNQMKNNNPAFSQALQDVGRDSSSYYMTSDYTSKLNAVGNVKSVTPIYVVMTPTSLKFENQSAKTNSLMSWSSLLQESSLDIGKKPGKNEIVLLESDVQKINPTAYNNKDWKSMLGKSIDVTLTLISSNGPIQVTVPMKVSGVMGGAASIAGTMTSFDTLKSIYKANGVSTQTAFSIVTINEIKNVKKATTDIQTMKVNGKLVFATEGAGSVLDSISQITSIVSYVLAAIAGISLIVSIFMIIVTTYMSVAARTKEIGILRAMGGRRKDVSRLFTAESFILGIFSAIIAIVVAVAGQIIINSALHSLVGGNIVAISPAMILLAVVIALIIAYLASLAPAARAARLNTIESLASE